MSLKEIYDAEINPFCFLKIRQIFAWYLLFLVGTVIQFLIIYKRFGFDITEENPLEDPLSGSFYSTLVLVLTTAWIVRKCNLVGINLQYLIGKISAKYDWRSLIFLVIATVLFTKGVFRVSYYHLSFLNPSLLEHIFDEFRKNSVFTEASQSFSPPGYYLFYPITFVISEFSFALLIFGIILHRWSIKWEIKKIISGILLFYVLSGGYTNIIATIIVILIEILLYFKTKNLIVPIFFSILYSLFFYAINFLWTIIIPQTSTNDLTQFRSEFGIGIILTCISAPFVLGFIYKNWHYLNEELPYFANKHKAEL